MTLFEKIYTNLFLDWNIEEIESKFTEDVKGLETTAQARRDGAPHWQYYATGIRFARNFSLNFKKECVEVVRCLKKIQSELSVTNCGNNPLIQEFIDYEFNQKSYKFVNLMKIEPGTNVAPHTDLTRSISINIGLKNSNSCKTIVTNLNDKNKLEDFDKYEKYSYVMNDGDVYLLAVNYVHAVKNIHPGGKGSRYVVTYTLKG